MWKCIVRFSPNRIFSLLFFFASALSKGTFMNDYVHICIGGRLESRLKERKKFNNFFPHTEMCAWKLLKINSARAMRGFFLPQNIWQLLCVCVRKIAKKTLLILNFCSYSIFLFYAHFSLFLSLSRTHFFLSHKFSSFFFVSQFLFFVFKHLYGYFLSPFIASFKLSQIHLICKQKIFMFKYTNCKSFFDDVKRYFFFFV